MSSSSCRHAMEPMSPANPDPFADQGATTGHEEVCHDLALVERVYQMASLGLNDRQMAVALGMPDGSLRTEFARNPTLRDAAAAGWREAQLAIARRLFGESSASALTLIAKHLGFDRDFDNPFVEARSAQESTGPSAMEDGLLTPMALRRLGAEVGIPDDALLRLIQAIGQFLGNSAPHAGQSPPSAPGDG